MVEGDVQDVMGKDILPIIQNVQFAMVKEPRGAIIVMERAQ